MQGDGGRGCTRCGRGRKKPYFIYLDVGLCPTCFDKRPLARSDFTGAFVVEIDGEEMRVAVGVERDGFVSLTRETPVARALVDAEPDAEVTYSVGDAKHSLVLREILE